MRKGSALLIVLGMLSFMIVSAVGFSIYMRSSRVPSSYLRRNVAARYLARAALAKAIEELEGDVNTDPNWGKVSTGETDVPRRFYGIYDDPFPGVVLSDSTARANPQQNGDYWLGRVFMPFGAVLSTDATVATLTLEALAYLPPAIVDDVRRLSRFTRTASWRSFPYDAGRYAYCAVNVSDLFDINRLRADMPRNSGSDRITLASLCAQTPEDVMDLSEANAKALDDILDRVEDYGKLYGNAVPFTSLADFNFLAGSGSDYAPFMRFIGSGRGNILDSASAQQANALFITDTWFPPAEAAADETVYYLDSNAQPFKQYTASSMGDIGSSSRGVLNTAGNVGEMYERNLGIGLVCLYDYLDSDSKPSSLALPTVEAVPMVVGVSAPAGLSPELGEINSEEVEIPNIRGTAVPVGSTDGVGVPVDNLVVKRKITLFGITSFGGRAMTKVVVTSPFKRLAATRRAGTYRVRGLMRVWLAPNGMGCRPAFADNVYPSGVDSWRNGVVNNGVATFLSDEKTLSEFAGDVKTANDAVAETTLTFSDLGAKMPIYYHVEEQTPAPPAGYRAPVNPSDPDRAWKTGQYNSFGNVGTMREALRPLRLDGNVDDAWQSLVNNAKFYKDVAYPKGLTEFNATDSFAAKQYRLYAAVWVQVMNGSQVVDMVPACLNDDVDWLNADEDVLALTPAMKKTGTDNGAPLLNFKGDKDISYATIENQTLAQDVAYDGWKALYAVDPRYNFAPEDWFSSSAGNDANKAEWMQLLGLNGTSSPIFGQGGRDHDMFMFVSDQEYLQSIGELQFLPWLEEMDGNGRFLEGTYNPNFHGEQFSNRTGPTTGNFANGGRFWKTYSAYPVGGVNNTNFRNPYDMQYSSKRVTVKSGTGGFKLNPFSRDDRVISAALIGTPFDYYVASTNSNQTQSGGRRNNLAGSISLSQMMSTYSFGKSSLAKMSSEELDEIAGEIKDQFEANADAGKTDWVDAWDSLMWQENSTSRINDENKTFMDTDITLSEPLHGVDRKYLYSFWRDCFDNRQQLFLLFVRAEPSSVGGGGLSRASSQLGSRAVALVWRDPAIPEKNKDSRPLRTALNNISDYLEKRGGNQFPPHRTRVLFYHQFD